jgi:hypothetical protein
MIKNKNTPDEPEIVQALMKMRMNKSPGPSGVTVINMIRNWQQKAKEGDSQCKKFLEIWEKIIEIVQSLFKNGDIPTVFTYGILVLLPKKNRTFRGIALLETI